MTRPRLILAVTAAFLILPASLWASASGSPMGARAAVTVHRIGQRASSVRAYWTKERMRTAKPVSVLEAPSSAVRGPSDVGSTMGPGSVPATLPGRGAVTLPSGIARDGAPGTHSPLASFTSGAVPTSDYRTFPFSTIGRVFFTDPTTNQNYACSGTAVTSENESVVWTAGHCVHGGGAGKVFFTNWVFVPSYVDHTRPVGTWPALITMAPSQWISNANLRYDMAAAVVAPLSGQRLTDVTGGRGIQWNLPQAQTFTPYGYPAAAPFDGERIHYCRSDVVSTGNPGGSGPATLGIGCDMTQGSSGGGWIVGDQFLNSNVSYGIEGQPNIFFGPYFGDAAATLYQNASSSTLPGPMPSPSPPAPSPSPSASTPAPPASTPTVPPVSTPTVPPVSTPTVPPVSTPTVPPVSTPTPISTPTPPVTVDTTDPVLSDVRDTPDPFSPNGDRVKDKVKILFTLSEPARVTITIFKPSGVPLGLLVDADAPQAARYKARWNGKVGRKVVRNGTYGYLIAAVDAAGNEGTAQGTVRVRH